MKRLVVRIAALGTVVMLGLIAIAQAQRGTEETTVPLRQSSQGQPAMSASSTNPLREQSRPSADAQPPLSADTILTGYEEPVPTDEAAPVDDSMGQSANDPFHARVNQADVAASPIDEPAPDSYELPNTSAAGTQYAEAPADYGPYSQPANTLRASNSDDLFPSAPADLQADDLQPADSQAMQDDFGEPQRFAPDPMAAPANAFESAGTTPNQFGQYAAAEIPMSGEGTHSGEPVGEGTGRPGGKQLEGPQSSQLTIQKSAPEEIQVGKPATFQVTVRNPGKATAQGVEIHDRVPQGTRLISTKPRASRGTAGELVWTLGAVQPGEETTVEMQVMPIAEGEIGSVATVRFGADASVRTVATKPELLLHTSAPEQVLIGEKVPVTIEVSNPGSGVATGIVLEEHVPAGLEHPAGSDLEYEIGDLKPGESRKLELTLVSRRPGRVTNLLTAHGEGNLRTEDQLDVDVVAPQLAVAVDGPKRRYLEGEATYRLSVHNPGTAPAQQVEMVAYLPNGMEFVSANNAGHFEKESRTVHWRLEELPSNETGVVELVAMPVEVGQQKIRLCSTAEMGLKAEEEQQILVEGIAAILFEVVDVSDPIEVGSETSYEIRVLNQGSKAATNVRLDVLLPSEMRAVSAEGPTGYGVDHNRVLFEPLSRLAPKADTTYRVRAQGIQPGDLRIRVRVLTDEMRSPVTKEESTRVYSDE